MKIVTRQEAIKLGLTRYFTGKPCKWGHVSERRTSPPVCVACDRESSRKWRAENKDIFREYLGERRANNKDRISQYSKEYRAGNKSRIRERHRKYCADNKSQLIEYRRKWRADNKDRVREYQKENLAYYRAIGAKRRAQSKRATPPWADNSEIIRIYEKAIQATKDTGTQMNVDHIVPLSHPKVCGLHIPGNLRVISKSENQKKSNYHWPNMPQDITEEIL